MIKQIRIDDIGASSKLYNQYSWFNVANYGPLKGYWPFKSWGPYEELTVTEWQHLIAVFNKNHVQPIIAVTACWVEADNTLTPFPQKFPEQALLLKEAYQHNHIVIANHGLSHCIVGQHVPRFWGANRSAHREFWPELSAETHHRHIQRSQQILEGYFGPITIFVPPGNVWSRKTYTALQKTSIKKVIANRYMLDSTEAMQNINYIDDRSLFWVLHDKDIKENGINWFTQMLEIASKT